jgi:DNA-damage-inducible protein J
MAKTASLNIRIDPETKAGAEELFGLFGITVTDAVNIFLRQSLMEGGFPFSLKQPRYNAATEAAMRECDELLASGNYTAYNSAKEMHEAILAEDDDV